MRLERKKNIMSNIIARTYSGAIDLYHGMPNLLNSTIEDVTYDDTHDDHRTTLVIRDVKGILHNITIAEA